ncbi:protein KOKOPELLI isoform X2 [Copidosoma floridanum]|uniref:protein KOKOPELLI isoform X2 n=1 Tax=Copidosoma floridanum TaxID=29053 RepID=UPI0006C95F9B|nr:protein KOKOPELLI isoform X2 [Copidosoma floridanum]
MTDPATASAAPATAPRVDGIMLKFLTHKLRSHSLNEDPKADDDRDSGTESDDEFQNGGNIADEVSTAMDSLEEVEEATSAAAMAVENARDSAVPSDVDLGASPSSSSFGLPVVQAASSSSGCSSTETPPIEQSYEFLLQLAQTDQHSSEEELEVINGPKLVETAAQVPPQPRKLFSAAPEKRKWSEANSQQPGDGDNSVAAAYSAPVSRVGRETGSGSSDEEGLGFSSRSGSAISQPVQFRSSPPSDAHKPVRSLSPPPKLFHASAFSAATEPRFHPHRPRSRPRLSSQYHSHVNLDHHHHHHHYHHHHHFQPLQQHSQHQQQDLADIDVVSACSPRKRHRPPHRLPRPCLDFEKMQQAADRLFVLSSKQS